MISQDCSNTCFGFIPCCETNVLIRSTKLEHQYLQHMSGPDKPSCENDQDNCLCHLFWGYGRHGSNEDSAEKRYSRELNPRVAKCRE